MFRVVKSSLLVAVGLLGAGVVVSQAGDNKLTPAEFLTKAIDCNLAEKDLAEKAVKNAQSADVRKYAQRLVHDHTANNKKAMELAKDLKIGVVSGTSKEHRDTVNKLMTATGQDFDRKFIHHMVQCHEKALKMFDHCAKDSTNNEVRAYAKETLPVLREHLEEARKLDKSLNK